MKRMTTMDNLRNWVDNATCGWMERTDTDVETIAKAIQLNGARPAWGRDWSDYLEAVDLVSLADSLPTPETAGTP